MSRLLVFAALSLAALALLAPSLWLGTLPSNSSPQNITWASQFSEQVRAGILYPRWMPHSFDGFGSPAFYFYPPLPFWLDALIDLLTLHLVPADRRLSLDWLVLLWLSGAAMYAFLRAFPLRGSVALAGALGYMAAPYHLFDHYIRGAYAEFAAYIAVPLVALGLRYTARSGRSGPVLLAAGYGMLALSHLPSALLVSVTLVPAYAGYLAWFDARKRWHFLMLCVLALGLGLGLAAVYVVPALRLLPFISTEQLWIFRPAETLLLFPPEADRYSDFMVVIDSIAVGCCLAALVALMLLLRQQGRSAQRAEGLFWATLALVGLGLIAGLVPFVWRLPVLSKVQFAWRLFVVIEFAVIVALCLAPWRAATRPARLVAVAALIALFPGLTYMGAGTLGRIGLKMRGQTPPTQDVKEYIPAGYPQHAGYASADLGLEPLAGTPVVACAPAADLCTASGERFGALSLHIRSAQTTTVTVGRFYFPSWQLDPLVPIAPSEPHRLVSFISAPGDRTYRLQRRMLAEETIGGAASVAAVVLLIGLAVVRPRFLQ